MTNKEINKKLEEGILDLWSKDICELVQAGRLKEARSVANYFGVPKKEMNEIIQEYEDGK
jgi:hypothetical protein